MLAGAGEAGSQARLRSSEKINKILKMSDSDEEELDKEAVGKKIAEELPAEILQEYKDIFSYFDRDGGGSIGAEEFDQVMRFVLSGQGTFSLLLSPSERLAGSLKTRS